MSFITFLVFLGACGAAATTGAMFGPSKWYEELDKPDWTPPNWVFPLGWAILYPAIAIAAWRVAFSDAAAAGAGIVSLALALWALQIALNAVWTPMFFGLQRLFGGLVVVGCMWVAVLLTTGVFISIDWLAGLLFLLYLAWTTFAAALNYDIWKRSGDEEPPLFGSPSEHKEE